MPAIDWADSASWAFFRGHGPLLHVAYIHQPPEE